MFYSFNDDPALHQHPLTHMFLLLNLLCNLVVAGARSTPMDTDSDGGHNTEEEANLMRKSSKEEKRLETEFKEQAKKKAEVPKKEKEHEKAGNGRGRPKLEYAKLISKLGKC